MEVPLYLVSASICGVLAQRLVRSICPDCKVSDTLTEQQIKKLGLKEPLKSYKFFKGEGCKKCGDTGYKGRIAIFELLVLNKKLRNIIELGGSTEQLRTALKEAGMQTLWEDGLDKAREGKTTIEEIERVAHLEE